MQVWKEYLYKLFSSKNDDALCNAHFLFQQSSNSERPWRGRIEVTLKYEDPNMSLGSNQKYVYAENWEIDISGLYYWMRIGNFILPHPLRKEGIGLFIWSEIKNNLHPVVSANLKISGKLSSVDAEIPLLDEKRKFVQDAVRPFGITKNINNIESRNKFWGKLLSQGTTGEPIFFKCDPNGDGAFSGWLKDPFLDAGNYRPKTVKNT